MQIFYLKAVNKVECSDSKVRLSDVAVILGADDQIQKKLEQMYIYEFTDPKQKRAVISVLLLIELIQDKYPDCSVVSLGEADVVLERLTKKPNPVLEKVKIAAIAILCFFGTAFTIMAFHNDINIESLFSEMYEIVTGEVSDGFTELEVSYSIGLAVGIIVFFNHIGKRRITKDPTPIEVQMRQYEKEVVMTLVETADRNEQELEP